MKKSELRNIIKEVLNESANINFDDLFEKNQLKIIAQYEAIRKSGQTNMFDVNTVKRIAFGSGFNELYNFINNNPKNYGQILKAYSDLIGKVKDIPKALKLVKEADKPMNVAAVEKAFLDKGVHWDQISRKGDGFIVRKGYFYKPSGASTEGYEKKVLSVFPDAKIVDSGDHWKPFKGGASLANQSHFYVIFKLG